ncbi:uncharacterized protein LOC132720549 [Ruditapes philippinarum]|uniref:uncharacterized protein LOC132720549 n=1 Tax=Ruditapes philippinarum TaxID=129788 RepID=UPI00295B18D1|nr:uncharacterized protein LOC132720549 [Ruditapes philippinarum]
MDNDDSVSIIPDTPSSFPAQGKIHVKRTNSVINISSDDSFRSSVSSDINQQNEIKSTGQRTSPVLTKADDDRNINLVKNRNRSDSPTFNCRRQLLHVKTSHVSKTYKPKSNGMVPDSKSPPLPGSPEFARERAEVLQRKKMKNKISPFSQSKFQLSPLKAGVNCLSACKPNDKFMWSPSPIKDDSVKNGLRDNHYSGFVKSSCLLTRPGSNASKSSVSASTAGFVSSDAVKAKKRKVETISSQDTDCVVRPKAQKQKATFSWPSSSDSDDEMLTCSKNKKMKKAESNANAKERFCGDSVGQRLMSGNDGINSGSVKVGVSQSALSINENLHKNTERNRITFKDRCKAKSSIASTRSRPINYLDNDEAAVNPRLGFSLGAKCKKSGNSSSAREGPSGSSLSPRHPNSHIYSSISPIKSTSPYSKHGRDNLGNVSISPKLCTPTKTPVTSVCPARLVSQTADNSNTHSNKNNYRISKSNRVVAPGVTELSPIRRQRPAHRNTDLNNSPLGTSDNPIDVTDVATPETKKALEEIRQMEADEEFARQMQEQLDMEFAMSLQNSEPNTSSDAYPHGATGSSPSGATNTGIPDTVTSQAWNTPVQARRGQRRNVGGARSRRDVHDNPTDEAVLQLLRQTMETINTELGASSEHDHVQFDQWLGNSPHRGGRRRRGRGRGRSTVLGGIMFSPAAGGEDYEHLMNLAEMLGEAKDKGLSKSDLCRLPVVPYKKTVGQEEIDECNICMTNYEEGDSQKILPCFHSFHSLCIDKWIKKNATCPICRVEVTVN